MSLRMPHFDFIGITRYEVMSFQNHTSSEVQGQLVLIKNIHKFNTIVKKNRFHVIGWGFFPEKEGGSRSRSPVDGMDRGDMRNVLRKMKESKTSPGRPTERQEKVIDTARIHSLREGDVFSCAVLPVCVFRLDFVFWGDFF